MKFQKTEGGSVLALEEVPRSEVHKYGVVKTKKKDFYSIEEVEKPNQKRPSNLSVVGRYILNEEFLTNLIGKKGFENEIQLTDSLGVEGNGL